MIRTGNPAPTSTFPRPLYLTPKAPITVRLGPGPSLEIHEPGRSMRPIPLGWIGRIVSNRKVQWEPDALFACLEHGIPLIHVDRGRVCGWCFGEQAKRLTLDQHLELILDRDDWSSLLSGFFRAEQRRAQLYALAALRVSTQRFEEVHLRGLLANRLRDRLGYPIGEILRQCEVCMHSLLAGALAERIHQPHLLALYRPDFHLPDQLGRVLLWHLYPILAEHLPRGKPPSEIHRSIPQLLESPQSPLRPSLYRLIGRFEHYLANLDP